ncbi:MAG: peptide chain release factor family protein [Phycisphaerales bacterium JB040]
MVDPFAEIFEQPVERPTHPAALDDETLLGQCEEARGRRSGPGGQRRNKVETHVTLTHTPTGLSGQAGERRSLEENRRVALRRLRLTLATEHRVGVPSGDIRSELWRARVRGRKIACSTRHRDYPSMLAEAMDVLCACSWEPGRGGASTRLECTASQLIRLVAGHPPAFERVNDERSRLGKRPLRS